MDRLTEIVRNTDAHTETGAPLLARREAFAVAFVELQSATLAYRRVYSCEGMLPATVRQRAYELRHAPDVAARVQELYDKAAAGTTISTRARMVRLQEIVDADPSELVRVVAEPCRFCWGANGAYQWRDPDEFAVACARAIDEHKAPPSDAGGYGFTVHRESNPACEHCRGDGVARVSVTPTDKLSTAASRLIKSVRQKGNGEIEVQLHDQLAAIDMLNKMQSVYVDKSMTISAQVPATLAPDATPEQAREAYLRMIGSSG